MCASEFAQRQSDRPVNESGERKKLRMTAGPASPIAGAEPSKSPVPIEPPTATMAICPALSWWRSPCSCVTSCSEGIVLVYQKNVGKRKRGVLRGEGGPDDLRNRGCPLLRC